LTGKKYFLSIENRKKNLKAGRKGIWVHVREIKAVWTGWDQPVGPLL